MSLRRLRQAGRRHRGPGAHQRDVVDQADQPSQRAGPYRRRNRSRRAGHQQGQAGNLAGHEADPGEPVGQGGRDVSARQRSSRAPSAISPTTAPSSRSKRGSTACCTSATCRGRARSRTPTRCSKRGDVVECQVLSVDQEPQADRPGPQAAGRRPVGDDDSRQVPARHRSSPARSPRSPTSASSSSLEAGLEGLLHISELADHKVENPEEIVKVGRGDRGPRAARRQRRAEDRPEPPHAGGRTGRRDRRGRPGPWAGRSPRGTQGRDGQRPGRPALHDGRQSVGGFDEPPAETPSPAIGMPRRS